MGMSYKENSFMRTAAVLSLSLVLASLAGAGTTRLVSTQELDEMMKEGAVSIVDLRSDLVEYLKGHIPEAAYLHYETLRIGKSGVPAATLSAESYATFLAWLLAGFDHPAVFLLDGGYEKWVKEGRPVGRQYPKIEATSFPAKPFNLSVVSVGSDLQQTENGKVWKPLDQIREFYERQGATKAAVFSVILAWTCTYPHIPSGLPEKIFPW
jgi:3-mercaptopyruvate sulfurtransferase SseA